MHPEERGSSQRELINIMLERFAINEIAESICSAGFLALDPFVGYNTANGLVILEGNRRLATLQLLLDPTLCPKRFQDRWDKFQKRVPAGTRNAIQQITVQVSGDRAHADVLSYIGFRHVNGILEWEAEEKAAYIALLVEKHKWSYNKIADSIGSKRHVVEKSYIAHRVVEQAKAENVAGSDKMRQQFGVLNRALQTAKIQEFLGVTFPGDPNKSKKPARKAKRNLEDFVRWTFGTDEKKAVLEDSRQLTKWGTVLASQDAVRYLRNADDPRFERAFAKSGGLKEGLVDGLLGAADRLEEAIPLIRKHKAAKEVKEAVNRCADYFVQVLRYFPIIQEDQGITLQDDRIS